MNNNFTQWKSKNLVTRVSGFFTTLPVLPASSLFAVNSLLREYYDQCKLPVFSISAITEAISVNKQHEKLIPVIAVHEYAVIKKSISQ